MAETNRLPVFGCAPMCRGHKLASYASAGVRLDHESYTVEEALEKLRNGMFVVIRESRGGRLRVADHLLTGARPGGVELC